MLRFQSQLIAMLLTISLPSTGFASRFQGISIPDSVQLSGKTLKLNGVGMLEVTLFNVDVYIAALYLERPTRNPKMVTSGKHPWCVITHFVRDIGGSQLSDGWREHLYDLAGKRLPELKKRIDRLVSLLPNVKKGDRHHFLYDPGRGLELRINGKSKGIIKGADFSPLVAKAFVGPDVDENLKNAMLRGF